MSKDITNCCPYCPETNNIDWGSPELVDGEEIKRTHFCRSCRKTWTEYYILTIIEDNNYKEIWRKKET